jgi:hypothetical protein
MAAINYWSKCWMLVCGEISTLLMYDAIQENAIIQKLRLPHSQVHWASACIYFQHSKARIDYQGQVFPHECPHSDIWKVEPKFARNILMPRSRMFVNFPMETWLLTKHKPDLNFPLAPRRRLFIFSAAAATCWQQTSKQAQEYKRTSESARAGEIFERPASFVCMSQPVALLLVLFRRLAPYLQLSSVFLLWHVDTRFFSFYYTTHQRAASKPATHHAQWWDVHLFGGAGLCSLGALSHTPVAAAPSPARGALELWPPALFVYLP